MRLPDDFIPDFTLKASTGAICNRNSILKVYDRHCVVSLFNKLNFWNISTLELSYSLGYRKHSISSFALKDHTLVIGYDDGTVEIYKNFVIHTEKADQPLVVKLHSKKVTKVILKDDVVFISSNDGSLCLYDLILEDVKHWYGGNSAAIRSIFVSEGNLLLAACADKSVKVWNTNSPSLSDAFVFEDDVFDMIAKGNQLLALLKSGNSFIVNLDNKERRSFEKFKNLRNVFYENGILAIQCQKKAILYDTTGEDVLKLSLIKRSESKSEYYNVAILDKDFIFVSKDNAIVTSDKTFDFGFHKSEILDVKVDGSKIYSFSKDRLVTWTRSVENPFSELTVSRNDGFDEEALTTINLQLHSSFNLRNATSLDLLKSNVIIGTTSSLIMYSPKLNEIIKEITVGNVRSVSCIEDLIAVAIDSSVLFIDSNFEEVNQLELPEQIVCSKFTPDGSAIFCSCLDNKIYEYLYPSFQQRLTLYGHSLPVKSFSFSPDQKLLVSCGADRLVKLWGLEFGDCRKSFIGHSKNAEFLNESLFMFSEKSLQYYNYFDHLKSFTSFVPGIVQVGTDYVVVSSDRAISLYHMNKFEYVKEEDEEDLEAELLNRNIASIKVYDDFLNRLENLSENYTESAASEFFTFLASVDLNELKEYFYVLDYASISSILKTISLCYDYSSIAACRIFLLLFRSHQDACVNSIYFKDILSSLMNKITELRKVFNKNFAQLSIDLEKVNFDIDENMGYLI